MRSRRADKGFTLIELLVVIIIIGILAAIAIPAFLNQRTKAHDATLKSDIKSAVTTITTASDGLTSWSDFSSQHGLTGNSVVAENNSGARNLVPPGRFWEEQVVDPAMSISDGTLLEIVIATKPDSLWTDRLPVGEFCIKASNIRSSYNKPWSPAKEANKSLYYDSALGKTLTIEQLNAFGVDPQQVSCYGFVKSYRGTL